ncbi:hypothetical protein [Niallia taxi]|uniref:Uncharacterized protein n=1 Tax=Niallia taxi TaxID=2499688 RepID=A0A437K428_9BACI|nr:hypothetical protein [Niallia taxi]RVT57206.1 hypothetical protein EM808_25020 [Niallia taxi]
MDKKEYWERIYEENMELNSLYSSYWSQYSNYETWQFWIVISLLVIPLVLLISTVNRKNVFELFFFGYTIHMLWTYMDLALNRNGYFIHQYYLTPFLPVSLNITASVLPVGFLLIYQYCSNNNKNFYFYAVIISCLYAFGFASIEKYFAFVELRKGMNLFYLFFLDLAIAFISYWLTKAVLKMRIKVNS